MAEIAQVESALNVQKVQPMLMDNFVVVHSTLDQPVPRMLGAYRNLSGVEFAEPNYIASALEIPNDPMFSQQWGLPKLKEQITKLLEDI